MKIINYLICLSLALSTLSCEKEIIKTKEPDQPLLLQIPQVSEINEQSGKIFWQTDIPCKTVVKYISSHQNDTLEIKDDEFCQNHSYALTNLQSNTTYYFRTISTNIDNLSIVSEIESFVTLPSIEISWNYFENGDFINAEKSFNKLIEAYDENIEIMLGLAWSMLRIDSLQSSLYEFTKLYELNNNDMNSLAGLSIANYLSNNIVSSINFGELFLAEDTIDIFSQGADYNPLENPFYTFEHDTSINNLDISIIMAENYFYNMDYEMAKQTLDFLMPNNTLHPHDSTSWKLNNIEFDNYEDALEEYVNYLKSIYHFL